MKLTDNFESIPGIYIIKCLVNEKCYVGETKNIRRRIKHHQRDSSQLIHRALKKHGVENFEIEIFYYPNLNKEELLNLEEEFIKKFDSSTPNGYNILKRGTDMSEFNKGNKWSLGRKSSRETKEKISKANIGNKSKTGQKLSDETKRKISQSQKGLPRSKSEEGIKSFKLAKSKPVLQIDPESNNVIKRWESVSDASKFFSSTKKKMNSIWRMLAGKQRTAYGFKWSYTS